VPITLFARLLFEIDPLIAVICEASESLAIRPAGLSAAELSCVPVDSRSNACDCRALDFCRFNNPRKESMFVEILVLMPSNLF
jgi:hypothetical protein